MSELFDSDFLNKIQQLTLRSNLQLVEGASGNRKSKSKGSSVEFSDYREYALGDDFRRIDWNAYGRFEKLYIKLFMEEREAPVNIFLDTSKSMDWGRPNKSHASRRLAAALGYISLSSFDRVSIYCLSNKQEKKKLNLRGKNLLGELLSFLEAVDYSGQTDLYSAVCDTGLKSTRGITILISDFFSKGSLEEVLRYLQFRKQEVYICQILSPEEVRPELQTSLRLIDSETEEARDVTVSPMLLKTYNKVYKAFVSGIEDLGAKKSISYFLLESTMPIEQMVKEVVGGA